jgi:cell division septation protein DedD
VSDEGFREIQLNGKQLIFLFMAVTVVLVVTFLFGVLTGRGVREDAAATEIVSGEVVPNSGAPPPVDSAPPPAPAGGAAPQAPAAPATEELSYAERLLRDTPAEEHLKSSAVSGAAAAPAPVVQEPVAEKAPVPPPPAAREKDPAAPPPAPRDNAPAPVVPAPKPAQPTSVPAPAVAAQTSDPTGPGYAVQVAAYRDRRDADTLAKQLTAKGYPAFVMDPVKGTSTSLFRVRVGKYKTLKDAEAIEARLQSAEQLTNAWIAR